MPESTQEYHEKSIIELMDQIAAKEDGWEQATQPLIALILKYEYFIRLLVTETEPYDIRLSIASNAIIKNIYLPTLSIDQISKLEDYSLMNDTVYMCIKLLRIYVGSLIAQTLTLQSVLKSNILQELELPYITELQYGLCNLQFSFSTFDNARIDRRGNKFIITKQPTLLPTSLYFDESREIVEFLANYCNQKELELNPSIKPFNKTFILENNRENSIERVFDINNLSEIEIQNLRNIYKSYQVIHRIIRKLNNSEPKVRLCVARAISIYKNKGKEKQRELDNTFDDVNCLEFLLCVKQGIDHALHGK